MSIIDTIKRAVFGKVSTNVRELRRKKDLNQSDFWSRIGVTQSGGSRYESGRGMPRPVAELVRIAHVEEIDTTQLVDEQAEIVRLLQAGKLSASVILQRQGEYREQAQKHERLAEQFRRGEIPAEGE